MALDDVTLTTPAALPPVTVIRIVSVELMARTDGNFGRITAYRMDGSGNIISTSIFEEPIAGWDAAHKNAAKAVRDQLLADARAADVVNFPS